MSSTPTTTPEPVDLDAVDARIPDGYTAPWDIDHDYESDGGWRVCYDTDAEGAGLVAVLPDYGYELALFIAHARTDVPALVAEVRQLRGALAEEHAAAPATGRVPLADHPALEWLAIHLWQTVADGDGSMELHSRLSGWLRDRQATGLDEAPPAIPALSAHRPDPRPWQEADDA